MIPICSSNTHDHGRLQPTPSSAHVADIVVDIEDPHTLSVLVPQPPNTLGPFFLRQTARGVIFDEKRSWNREAEGFRTIYRPHTVDACMFSKPGWSSSALPPADVVLICNIDSHPTVFYDNLTESETEEVISVESTV